MLTKNKIEKPFTLNELEQIRYSFARVAKKHNCQKSYVQKIANGRRDSKSELAKDIIKTLRQLLHVLKPINNK